MDSGGEVVRRSEGVGTVAVGGVIGSISKVTTIIGVNEANARGCEVSLTLCCPCSQCFWHSAGDIASGTVETASDTLTSSATTSVFASSMPMNCIGQA